MNAAAGIAVMLLLFVVFPVWLFNRIGRALGLSFPLGGYGFFGLLLIRGFYAALEPSLRDLPDGVNWIIAALLALAVVFALHRIRLRLHRFVSKHEKPNRSATPPPTDP